jgi:hypothetical protein
MADTSRLNAKPARRESGKCPCDPGKFMNKRALLKKWRIPMAAAKNQMIENNEVTKFKHRLVKEKKNA